MNDDIDTRLEAGLLHVPDDFTDQVMRCVETMPLPARRSKRRERLQWLALAGGAALGLSQLLAFMFGMWAASAAM
jgi:hypothetical protein